MKNQKNTKALCGLFLSIVFSSLLFTSCKKGDQGTAGSNGAAGANGSNGANGTNGNTILSGEGVPDATLGITGDFYLDTKTTSLYGPKTAGGWGSPVSLTGTPGTPGAPGTPGEPGTPGTPGIPGSIALVDTFSIYTNDWTMSDDVFVQQDNSSYSTYVAKYYKRWVPDITKDILDHGMVMVSFTPSKENEPTQWLPIPYTITGYDPNSTRVNYNWSYVTGENTLRVQFYLTPLSNVTYYPAAMPNTTTTLGDPGPDIADFNVPDAQYKVVIIPATVTEEITSITKRQFTRTGKVLSN